MKKAVVSRLLAVTLAFAMIFVLASCGNKEEGTESNSGSESTESSESEEAEEAESEGTEEKELDPGVLSVSLGFEPASLDPAINATTDGSTMLVHLFSGLAKWGKDGAGRMTVIADAAERLVEGKSNDDGTVTYTYKLKEGLKWSDGEPVKAQDFVYAWQRASRMDTGGAYFYLFDVIDGYNEGDSSAKLNIKASDDRTLEVTLAGPCSYWDELLALPPFFPVREDAVSSGNWAGDPSTLITNGPYKMTSWEHNSEIVLEKNADFYDAASVSMEKLVFKLTEDTGNMLGNFKTSDWQFIDDVPNDQINDLATEYPDEFVIAGQDATYYVCWNINKSILPANTDLSGDEAERANAEIRKALGLLIDRNHIVNEITRSGQLPASTFVAMGVVDADGKEFYLNANKAAGEGFVGYFDSSEAAVESNRSEAVEVLKKYYEFDEASGTFTNFPPITYLYNTSGGHQAIGEYLKQAMAEVGIELNLIEQEFESFMTTRNNGDYILARNSWVADYNDPICFLDMWTSVSGNNDIQFGRELHSLATIYNLDLTDLGYKEKIENGTWSETYDMLISKISKEKDKGLRYELMHKAEDMLMDTGCISPLFYFTDIYMINSHVKGFYSNPMGTKYFMNTTVE